MPIKTTFHVYDHAHVSIIYLIVDVDECTTGVDQCDQNCHNNVGSYTCSCNAGFTLNDDGFRCDGMHKCSH